MSFEDRLSALKDTYAARLPGSVKTVYYRGETVQGVISKRGIMTTAAAFADTTTDAQPLKFLAADISAAPAYGDKITVDDADRIIRAAALDASGVWWMVETGEYYSEWCDIADDATAPTVYVQAQVRVMDATEGEFAQANEFAVALDSYVVVMRVADWPEETAPQIGYLLTFDAAKRKSLRVADVITRDGDYRMMCREGGDDG